MALRLEHEQSGDTFALRSWYLGECLSATMLVAGTLVVGRLPDVFEESNNSCRQILSMCSGVVTLNSSDCVCL